MINKKNSKTWVKIVAWVLAISFALSMTIMFAIPGPSANNGKSSSAANNSSTGKPDSTPVTSIDTSANIEGVLGQGDLALKNGNIDQAIGFYEDAYELNKEEKTVQEKLGSAYFTLGEQALSTDSTKAKDAFEKYLKLLPDGPQAEQARSALDKL
jgi:tetratricopeptide (TPR) repeat protein